MVVDASAVLALLFNEEGAPKVRRVIDDAVLSAVNAAEVVSTLIDRQMPATEAEWLVSRIVPTIVPFGPDQAFLAGSLRALTRHLGLSLGDRACLALAMTLGDIALTADRVWMELSLDVKVKCIR
jgi:PIN domain nuclease of toxin-antitoxin system